MHGRSSGMERSNSEPPVMWNNTRARETGLEESMWQLGLSSRDSYPERAGEPNCVYYMRTGTCGYGVRCRFNHPHDRSLALGAIRQGEGEYPEREGQPVCQYFVKTGTCKFGASCKFHHPKFEGGAIDPVPLNYHGYPLRPGDKECSYYVKTGQCKFGETCKFHHPQPSFASLQAPAPEFYPTVQSPLVPPAQQFGGVASWQVPRPPFAPGSYVQGTYGSVLVSPGMIPVSGWSPYPAPVSQVASPSPRGTIGAGPFYGITQLSPSAPSYAGSRPPLPFSTGISSSSDKEHAYPERPGQPECRYYIRTGECKYGSMCRYHHPPEWTTPDTICVLSPIGLPLRQGSAPCSYYAQYGVCKYGPACKFDHSIGTLSYSPSASSLADMPVAPYPVGSSAATLAPSSSSSDFRPEYITGSNKDSFSTTVPSSDNMSSGSVGSLFSKSGSLPHSDAQITSQNSAPSSGGSTTGPSGDVHSSS